MIFICINVHTLCYVANWSITNLRPAPPLRPSIANASSSSTVGSGGVSGHLSKYSIKVQPTYEEDALVLRVIEAYCAAYQNTSRNTMHSGKLIIAQPSHITFRARSYIWICFVIFSIDSHGFHFICIILQIILPHFVCDWCLLEFHFNHIQTIT